MNVYMEFTPKESLVVTALRKLFYRYNRKRKKKIHIYIKELQQAPLEFNHKKDRFNYSGGLLCFEIDTKEMRGRLGSSLSCNPIWHFLLKAYELQTSNYKHTYTHK